MTKKHTFSYSKVLSLFLAATLFMAMFAVPAFAVDTQTETAHYIDSDGETIAESTKSNTEIYKAPAVGGYTYRSQSVQTTNVYAEQHITYIVGYPDGGVKAENNMPRSEAVAVLYRLYNGNIPSFTKRMSNDTFADVSSSAWYYKELETLYNVGIIADSGAFRPDEPITRAEFATLCAKYDGLTYLDKEKFSDVQSGHPAYSYINAAAEADWIVGYPDGTFRPDNNITRAEVMTLVNRLFNRIPSTEQIAHVKNPYNDIVPSHWAYCNVIEATVKHDTVDWHGADYNDGIYNIIVEKFVDTGGKEIAKSITTEGDINYHPAAIKGYSYLGYITEITYVYTNGRPAPGIAKTSNTGTAAVGDTVTYTITLKNDRSATDAWRDVIITDEIPEHMSLVHGSVYLGRDHADYSIKNNRLTVSVGDIAAGRTAKVSFDVIVLSTAYGETITNKATGKGSNSSTVTDTDDGITIAQGEIQPFIIKSADTDSAVVGQTITYTLSICR